MPKIAGWSKVEDIEPGAFKASSNEGETVMQWKKDDRYYFMSVWRNPNGTYEVRQGGTKDVWDLAGGKTYRTKEEARKAAVKMMRNSPIR